ncbi:MAG: hypothetical protein ACFBRM_07930 [Pikeienuella sp.]
MTRSSIFPVLLAGALSVTAATQAEAMRRGSNAVPEARAALKAEWARARAVGGYVTPLSALADLFAGRPLGPRQVQRVINPGDKSKHEVLHGQR